MFNFIVTTLCGEATTPSVIRLFDLGFDGDAGEELLNIILEKEPTGIRELDLQNNEEFWENQACVEMIKALLPKQEQLETVRLGFEFPYLDCLDDIPSSI